jgi:lipid-A-disaccharide synthase
VSAAPLVYLVAGEQSGDNIGAAIMRGLAATGEVRFAGVGGEEMRAAGLEPLFDAGELARYGLVELLPGIVRLWRRRREILRDIAARRPALLITIDAPTFNIGLAARRPAGLPAVHVSAPKAWAYGKWRIGQMARHYDRLLAFTAFEAAPFVAAGVDCAVIGHPALETGAGTGDGAGFRARHGISPERPLLLLLPGSRDSELARHLDLFLDVAAELRVERPDIALVVPTLAVYEARIRTALAERGFGDAVVAAGRGERFDAFAAADAALAASGTVTVELALADVPMAIAYRLHPLTAWLIFRLADPEIRHAGFANLVVDTPRIPEFLQEACTKDNVVAAMRKVLFDEEFRAAQRTQLAEARVAFGAGRGSPIDKAVAAIREILDRQDKNRGGRDAR